MKEQRQYPRFDVDADVQFKRVKGGAKPLKGSAKNISAEGFCFGCTEQFKKGDILQIDIKEQNTELPPLCVKAEVAWSRKAPGTKDEFLIGVKIVGIRDVDEVRFIMFYCAKAASQLKKTS